MSDALPSPRDPALRKRLGQYFTGERLARLVTALGGAGDARSILDPMGGSGDMLLAAASRATRPPELHYLELDPEVADIARARFRERAVDVHQHVGNAFDASIWANRPPTYDLVVTNPPYVRYQAGARAHAETLEVPHAEGVRAGLIACIESLDHPKATHHAFLEAARGYSGLADLAVPSWILCCARVAVNGRIAVLVPNTWLTRDYAKPILGLLTRFFEIEAIVDDRDKSWFDDALVRTSIVVARRVHDRGEAAHPCAHPRVAITRDACGPDSIVEYALPASEDPDGAFASWIRQAGEKRKLDHVEWRWSQGDDIRTALRPRRGEGVAPEALLSILGDHRPRLTTLADLGWKVGQGLRTGANDFFYLSTTNEPDRFTSPILGGESLQLPLAVLHPTLRRQAELSDELGRVPDQPQSMTLVLEGWALPEDAEQAPEHGPWQIIEGDLARLVRAAAAYRGGKAPNKKPIPELSAVRTNVRPGRFWYQLPPLAPRHAPLLFIPRVNNDHPRVRANPEGGWLVDSNFSTLWPTPNASMNAQELLEHLSSPWALACMELRGNVMGGGALKLEAAHLRQLPLLLPDTGRGGEAIPPKFQAPLGELLAHSLRVRRGGKTHLIGAH